MGVGRHPLHPIEICAGGKAPPFRRQYDAADIVVLTQLRERVMQGGNQRFIKRVVHLGPLQRHRRPTGLHDFIIDHP